ncbi:MAG: GIY-YIG nuclease family protein [Elusimicrobia bacterium]|nr:GIY-YIG nuclease family protein [Elusimicrobiota bacterium]
MRKSGEKAWSLYILRCGDETLYTGIAKDVQCRVKQHNAGKGAAYTRTHRPVTLVFQKNGFTRSEALVREARVKTWPRLHKEALISGTRALETTSATHGKRGRKRKKARGSLESSQSEG